MSNISTLKTLKVGDKVTMLTFTGMNLGQFEVTKASKTKVAIMKKDGTQAEFSRETGLQTNANNPKYANKIVDAVAEPEKKAPAKKAEKTEEVAKEEKAEKKSAKAKKPAKKVEKVEIPEDADDFEDDDLEDDFEEFDEE